MDIRMKQMESLYLASTIEGDETASPESTAEAVKLAGVSETEKAARAAKFDRQAGGMTDAGKAAKAVALRKLSHDKYDPEKRKTPISFGHYQQVSDGKGGVEIRFDPPEDEA